MNDSLCNLLITKGQLKQDIFAITLETLQLFKECAKSFDDFYKANYADDHEDIPVLYTTSGSTSPSEPSPAWPFP